MLRGFKDLLGYGSKPLGIPSHDQSDHDNDLPDAPSPTSNSTAARLPDDDLDIHPHKPQDVSPAVVDLPTAASTEAAPSYTKSRAWASNGEEELGSRRKPRLQTKSHGGSAHQTDPHDSKAAETTTKSTMMNAASSKSKKPFSGGYQPRDTLNTRPTWLPQTVTSLAKPNSAQKRSAPTRANGSSSILSPAGRPTIESTSASDFPQPASKRRKLEPERAIPKGQGASPSRSTHSAGNESKSPYVREGDGLDGRSTSFRDMDAMMNCKPTKRRSRDASQASVASQTGSSSSKGSYQSVKGVHTTAASHREDVHMEDHDATPVKDVASPHLVPNTPSIGKALDASRESLRRQQSRSPKKSLAGTNGHAEAGKLLHTNGTNAEATHRADVKDDLRPGSTSPAKSPTSGGIKGVVFEEPRIVKMEGEPTQPRPTTKPSQQAQHNELDDSDHRPKRLTEKFNRDDGSPRRHSIDPTDELQAEPNASRPSKQQRTDFQRRKAAGLAAQEKRKQNSKPGDGFDDEDLFDGDMKSLRQAGSRLRKPHTKFVEADKKPKAGYSVDGMIDGNTLHEHPGKIWVNHMTRSFDYQSPTGSAVIDPSNIVKAEWGVERHVRLLGSKTQHEQNLKHIVFGAKEDLQSFKADMLGFGMERNMQKSHLVYHDDDVRLQKIWDHSKRASDATDKDTASNALERPHAQRTGRPASPVKQSPAPKGKFRERMQSDEVDSEISNKDNRHSSAKSRDKPHLSQNAEQPARATRPREQHAPELAPRSIRKKASPPPRIRFSQRPGALGPRWANPLIFPVNGARSNVARVEWDDLERLDDDEFLNDNIVSFGLRWAFEKTKQSVKDDVHIFNTYFFASLSTNINKGTGINYNAVKRWTMKLKKENIFKYKYLVVPINENFHWYAAIVCNADKLLPDTTTQSSTSVNTQPTKEEAFAAATQDDPATPDKTPRTLRHDPSTIERRTSQMSLDDEKPPQGPFQIYEDVAEGLDSSKSSVHTEQHKPGRGKKAGPDDPVIIILDSFGGKHSDVTRILKNYLQAEAKDKCHRDLPAEPAGLMGKGIPLQPNFSDCGLYLIAYVNQFLKNPGRFVTKSVTRQMREKEDWPNFNAYTLREKCRNLVLGTGKQQNNLPLTAAEQAAIEEQEITHPASQELPVRDASHQDPKPKATQPQGKQRESGKHEDQERLADAYNGDDSGPHRPPTYDGFMRKHVYDVDDDDSVNAKIVNDSRPSTAQTGDGEASGAQGGFLAGITDYAADADNAHQDDDEMLLSDEPATSSPQGPQHVSQFFPPKEGASQVAQEVAEIMKRSPRLAGFAEQQRQKETLQRLKDEMPRGTEEDNEV